LGLVTKKYFNLHSSGKVKKRKKAFPEGGGGKGLCRQYLRKGLSTAAKEDLRRRKGEILKKRRVLLVGIRPVRQGTVNSEKKNEEKGKEIP